MASGWPVARLEMLGTCRKPYLAIWQGVFSKNELDFMPISTYNTKTMDAEKPEIPPPLLVSAVVCDQVIVDHFTGKASIIGVFDSLTAPKFPARHPSLAFFGQLTDGRGKVEITARLVDLKREDEVLLEARMEGEFKDIRQIVNLIFNFGNIVFPHPGEYRLQFHAGGVVLGERSIVLRQLERPSGEKHE